MILARLSRAVREQNWFAVALEFVIVIAGVVIGFQVTAWNEVRADRIAEQRYVERLYEDVLTSIADQANTGDAADAQFQTARRMAVIAGRGDLGDINEADFKADLSGLAGWRAVAVTNATLEEMFATGHIGLIQSDEIRSVLTEYRTQYQNAVIANGNVGDLILSHWTLVQNNLEFEWRDDERVIVTPVDEILSNGAIANHLDQLAGLYLQIARIQMRVSEDTNSLRNILLEAYDGIGNAQ